jgi:hypothetical protein
MRFIDNFRKFAADGVLTKAEWKQLEELASTENLDLTEALYYASPDISELIRKGIEIATRDNVITEAEEKYFDYILKILVVPDTLANEVRSIINEYKAAQEIRNGNLPTLNTSLYLWPNELCHLELPAIYINTDTKTYPRRSGKLWATNTRLVFISPERDFDLSWNKVMSVVRDGNTLFLEMSIKKGNGLYVVDHPLLAEAVISRLIEISVKSRSTKTANQERKKDKKQSDTNAKTFADQPQNRTPYEILDLPRDADADSIRLAYRKMAKLYHPDKVASLAPEFQQLAELKMKEINAAYQALLR